MSPEFLMELVLAVGAGVSVYAAIRADLAVLHERVTAAKDLAHDAHKRLDKLPRRAVDWD